MFTVKETNFSINQPWIFKLIDTAGGACYIMDADFYKAHGMISPITKPMLDSLDVGHTVRGEAREISGMKVLISIH